MIASSDLRMTGIPPSQAAGHMPALGFGTTIPDPALTITATRDALEAGSQRTNPVVKTGVPSFIPQSRWIRNYRSAAD